jgi:hypothetical protein
MVLCKVDGCKKTAMFNIKTEAKPDYCGSHKTEEMNDKVHKLCEKDNCNIRAGYNFEGEKPKFCKKHKLELMKYV